VKVGFTGTQWGMSKHQVEQLVEVFRTIRVEEFHHGDCIGADIQAHQIALRFIGKGGRIVVHPPNIDGSRAFCGPSEFHLDAAVIQLPPKEYLERDQDIVDACDLLVAAPLRPESDYFAERFVAWETVRMARKAGKEVIVLER